MGKHEVLILLVVFLASRILYAFLGVDFDTSPLQGYIQFIDPLLLQTRMIESIWFSHAHPPVLNVIAGVGLKFFGGNAIYFYTALFHTLGFCMSVS